MRRSVDWAFAGLASNGPWEELFYRAMLYGTTQTQVVPRVFTSEELARIEAPTLLVLGELERIYRPDKAARAPAAHAVGAGRADPPRASRHCDRQPRCRQRLRQSRVCRRR
jgi:hypothetical protein